MPSLHQAKLCKLFLFHLAVASWRSELADSIVVLGVNPNCNFDCCLEKMFSTLGTMISSNTLPIVDEMVIPRYFDRLSLDPFLFHMVWYSRWEESEVCMSFAACCWRHQSVWGVMMFLVCMMICSLLTPSRSGALPALSLSIALPTSSQWKQRLHQYTAVQISPR